MAFCPNCGSSVDGRFCQKCGGAVGVGATAAPPPSGFAASPAQPFSTAPAAAAGLTENSAGALCYLAGLITGIIFLVMAPYNQNPRIRFHAFQSILFHLAWVLGWFVVIALHIVLPFSISLLLSLISLLFWCGGFVLWLFLMWKASQGQIVSLPIIGAIARKQAGN
jgi:uncharacterized membrane protein